MTNYNPWPDPIDQRKLDRLVDGQLELPELRQLIEAFECDPDGWRRCAMAFLEAQILEQTIGDESFWEIGSQDALSHLNGRQPPNSPASVNDGCLVVDSRNPSNHVSIPTPINGTSVKALSQDREAEEDRQTAEERTADLDGESKPSLENLNSGEISRPSHDAATQIPAAASVAKRTPASTLESRSSSRRRWKRRLVVSGSLSLAFVLGIVGRAWFSPDRPTELASPGAGSSSGAGADDPFDQRSYAAERATPTGMLKINFDQPGNDSTASEPFDVPVFTSDGLPNPPAVDLPPDVKQWLEENQTQIMSRRNLHQFETEDGQIVLVPVETLELIPNSTSHYY